jgi:tyrosinase
MADVLVRQNVWTLSRENEWHPIIRWYERGVSALQEITDLKNPRSWIHLANIHGTFTPQNQWPTGIDDRDWNACQHGSWYFLPWHRIYLHHFEKIVRAAVVALGGPEDWALPFWNYDPADPDTLSLPPAFRAHRTPAGGSDPARDNALFVARRLAGVNNGQPIDADDVETTGFVPRFTAASSRITTFGGPITDWIHMGPGVGQLEREPHGFVHVDVGGDDQNPATGGFMSFFELAGRDPIFWLHHANVDRLWEVWRNVAGNKNTKNPKWLREPFSFGSGQWTTSLKVQDVEDTSATPLSYRYDGVPVPARRKAQDVRRVAARAADEEPVTEEAAVDENVVPELVAVSDTDVPVTTRRTLRAKRTKARGAGVRARRLADDTGRRVHLALENVTIAGEGGASTYVVHLNVPEGDDPSEHKDLRVGKISTFGLTQATNRQDDRYDNGTTFAFDITDIARRLERKGDWEESDVRVTVSPKGAEGNEPQGDLKIGRVGIYYE